MEQETENIINEQQNGNDVNTINGEPENNQNNNSFKKIKFIVSAVLILIVILNFTKISVIFNDVRAQLNKDDEIDNPYIKMVKYLKPIEGGRTYNEAFINNFDNNDWSYFKTDDGLRIVQVKSTNNGSEDELLTQFLVTPTDKYGQCNIETYAMAISGESVSEDEMLLIMAGIFESEVTNEFSK